MFANVFLTIGKGGFLAVVGNNGRSKSTLGRHFNALLSLLLFCPAIASPCTSSLDTNSTDLWSVRKVCAMVFQSFDNQFVSSIASEDVTVGLQNFNFLVDEILALRALHRGRSTQLQGRRRTRCTASRCRGWPSQAC